MEFYKLMYIVMSTSLKLYYHMFESEMCVVAWENLLDVALVEFELWAKNMDMVSAKFSFLRKTLRIYVFKFV